jgi:D-arabinose 1-dehydrogenase-like Zn-dependent alcohol dehydrogenase
MRAAVFEEFEGHLEVRTVPDPAPSPGAVTIRVEVTGLCRSDWHGWMGHDPDVVLPHVPGHEFAGTVAETGPGVTSWQAGDRVTTPFVCACGQCASCAAGDQQVCEHQDQPGFTYWGSFAEYVVVQNAEVNLVRLPDSLPYADAAALGCRFATAYRAVVDQGRIRAGQWVAVQGCGGVGLSAIMIAAAAGAQVVAVDVSESALELARRCGAAICINAASGRDTAADTATLDAATLDTGASGRAVGLDVAETVRDVTGGGAHLSIDALGSPATCAASVLSLRRRARHVQIGLLPAALGSPALPMDRVIAYELEILGSHGMPAHAYPRLLALITSGALNPGLLVTGTIGLDDAPAALASMGRFSHPGIRLIRP